jgi:hypothetical protein
MFLVIFLDANRYEFVTSLHATLAAAEAECAALLQHFVIENGEDLPPKAEWSSLCDDCGENPHIFRIACGGGRGEEIFLSSSEDQAA